MCCAGDNTAESVIDRDGPRLSLADGGCHFLRRHWCGVTLFGDIAGVLPLEQHGPVRVTMLPWLASARFISACAG